MNTHNIDVAVGNELPPIDFKFILCLSNIHFFFGMVQNGDMKTT